MSVSRTRVSEFFVFLFVLLSAGLASAIDWSNAGTGDWLDVNNWNPVGSPSGQKANIFNGGTAYIDSNAGTIQRFELAGPSGTTSGFLEIRNGGSLTTNNSGNTYVGARGTGVLTIEDGATMNIGPGSFYVGWRGADAGGHGDGTVIQQGGTVTMGKNIDLAQNDANTDGRYEIHGGSLTLTNTSTGYLQIGRQGTGTFVQTGGTVTVSRNGDALMVGSQGNATGRYEMSGASSVLNVPNGMLYVGANNSADGTFIQTNGTVTVGSALRMATNSASTSGRYEMHDGTLTVGSYLQIARNGTATFLQNGGTVNVNRTTDALAIGAVGGSNGTYEMNGGILNVPSGPAFVGHTGTGTMTISNGTFNAGNDIMVGHVGTGTVTQTGGTVNNNAAGNDVWIGNEAAGTGTWELGGTGVLNTDDLYVGYYGTGTFIQNGGTLNTRTVLLGRRGNSSGTYTMSAGDIVASGAIAIGIDGVGTFTQTGGDIVTSAGVYVAQNGGATGNSDYSISGGTLTTGTLTLGDHNTGKKGTMTISGTGTVSTGTLVGYRDGYLNIDGRGNGGTPALSITDGKIPSLRHLKIGSVAGADGAYINAVSATPQNFSVGFEGKGEYTQTAGSTSTLYDSYVGDRATGEGTLNLQAGTFNSRDLFVGRSGTGLLDQTGGTLTTDQAYVGYNANSSGAYRIGNDATVTVNELLVGQEGTGVLEISGNAVLNVNTSGVNFRVGNGNNSDGTIIQTGGTVTQNGSGAMYLGFEASAVGRYSISDGTLDQGSLTIGGNNGGTGIFTQTGGDVIARRDIRIGRGSGGDGSYSISDGTLTVTGSHLGVGYDNSATGSFTQTGGAVEVAQNLLLGNGGGNTGTYTMDAGTLTLTGGGWESRIQVGYQGHGTFIQNGGDVTVDAFVNLASESANTTGRYEIHGGTLTLPDTTRGYLQIGRLGTGTFVQTGGAVVANRTSDAVTIGANSAGAVGTYEMSGGTLDAPNGPMLIGKYGTGTFVQDAGNVAIGDSVRLAVYTAGSNGSYEIHDGSLTVGTYLQVGRLGTGTFTQTGGTVTVNRNDDALLLGSHGGGKGTYTISGGTLDVTNHTTYVGFSGTGTLDVLGSAAQIDTVGYSQNGASTLGSAIDNGGVTPVNVSGSASLAGDVVMGVHGGVALTVGDSFTVLSSGNRSGTLANSQALWDITHPGNDVVATLAGGLGTFSAGYATSTLVPVPDPGLNAGNLTIEGIDADQPLWVFLDVVDDGGDLNGAELDDLADYMASAGQTVYADGADTWPSHEFLTDWPALADYDLMLQFEPLADTSYLTWDFSDYDASLLVTGIAIGVPEPSTLILAILGLVGLATFRRRRRALL